MITTEVLRMAGSNDATCLKIVPNMLSLTQRCTAPLEYYLWVAIIDSSYFYKCFELGLLG